MRSQTPEQLELLARTRVEQGLAAATTAVARALPKDHPDRELVALNLALVAITAYHQAAGYAPSPRRI